MQNYFINSNLKQKMVEVTNVYMEIETEFTVQIYGQ